MSLDRRHFLTLASAGALATTGFALPTSRREPGQGTLGVCGGDYGYWMSGLQDSIDLRDMSIPGTHDSAAYQKSMAGGDPWVLTQKQNIKWQLDHGVRFLDIRLRRVGSGNDTSFALHHGDYYLKQMFGDVLVTCCWFLYTHPSETIVMRIKQEKSKASAQDFIATFNHYLDQRDWRRWFHIAPTFPSLRQARGKIVLVSEEPYLGYGLRFSSSQCDIQDRYNHPGFNPKKEAVADCLTRTINAAAPRQKLAVNFTSMDMAPLSIWDGAKSLNPYTLSELKRRYTTGKAVGVIPMDFIDRPTDSTSGGSTELPAAIVKFNPLSSTCTGARALTLSNGINDPATGPVYSGSAYQSFGFSPIAFPGLSLKIVKRYKDDLNRRLVLSMGADGIVNTQPDQPWNDQYFRLRVEAAPDDGSYVIYSIRGVHNNLALDMDSSGRVTGKPYNGNSSNQRFVLVKQGDGSTGIRSAHHWVRDSSSLETSANSADSSPPPMPPKK